MGSFRIHRRRVLAGLLAAGAPLHAFARAAPAPESRTVDGVTFMRAALPPAILANMMDVKRTAAVNEPVMEQSDVRQVREFRNFLDTTVARERSRLRQLELLNLYVNRRTRQVPDTELYLRADLWAPPLNTLLVGGDCEDIVLLKRWALKRLGYDTHGLYLVGGVSRTTARPMFHAVLGVAMPPGAGVILDSLTDLPHQVNESAQFSPAYALNEYGFWIVENPPQADRPFLDEIARTIQPEPVRIPRA